jgi:hypothetical protein
MPHSVWLLRLPLSALCCGSLLIGRTDMNIFLVVIGLWPDRAFVDKDKAEKHIEYLREQWDNELNQPAYKDCKFEIAEIILEK